MGLGACNKKEEVKAPETPAAVADAPAPGTTPAPAPAPTPEVKSPTLSADERAAKLGFVKHLPQDTEVVMSFHNGSKSAERIKASKIWKLVESEMGMGMMGGGRGPMGGQGGASIIASEWARQDPAAALAWANGLTTEKSQAMNAVVGEVAKTDPKKATEMLAGMGTEGLGDAYRSDFG